MAVILAMTTPESPVIQAVEYVRPYSGATCHQVEIQIGPHRFVHTDGEMTKERADQIVKELQGTES